VPDRCIAERCRGQFRSFHISGVAFSHDIHQFSHSAALTGSRINLISCSSLRSRPLACQESPVVIRRAIRRVCADSHGNHSWTSPEGILFPPDGNATLPAIIADPLKKRPWNGCAPQPCSSKSPKAMRKRAFGMMRMRNDAIGKAGTLALRRSVCAGFQLSQENGAPLRGSRRSALGRGPLSPSTEVSGGYLRKRSTR
jgi:hypothetical protein